jgi:hypothetical protein
MTDFQERGPGGRFIPMRRPTAGGFYLTLIPVVALLVLLLLSPWLQSPALRLCTL